MGRLGVVSFGLRGGTYVEGGGETIYQPATFIELPIEGFYQKELSYGGVYQNELLYKGWYEIEEVISLNGEINEIPLKGSYEKELEYEGEYNVN